MEHGGHAQERGKATVPVVPVVNEADGQPVYHADILRLALIGGLIGAAALGVITYGIYRAIIPVPYFGHFFASDLGPALFTGAGIGAATGGLTGALVKLYQLPLRRRM
ncbi:MAG: hypothetical protein AB1553_11240 [Nitrospirota bacterium]